MTEQAPDREAIDSANALAAALGSMSGQLAQLNAYGHRNRRLIVGLALSLVLDLVLTAAFTVVAVQAHQASASAAKAREVTQALCLSGNRARAEQIVFWHHVLHLSKSPRTRGQRNVTADFEAYLSRLYAPRDCRRINPKLP